MSLCQRCHHPENLHDTLLNPRWCTSRGCVCGGYIEEIDLTPLPEFPRGAA